MSRATQKWQEVMASAPDVQYTLGPNASVRYLLDPKRIGFLFARYKFAAKLLRDCNYILDTGCGDGFGTLTFLEDTKAMVHGIDSDAELIKHAERLRSAVLAARSNKDYDRLHFDVYEAIEPQSTINGGCYDGVCCLDVIEHVEPSCSEDFVGFLHSELSPDGIAVIGTPNILAAKFASPQSQIGHINLYDPDQLRVELKKQFKHVFLWGMQDEIPHLGFDRLWHYILALAIK